MKQFSYVLTKPVAQHARPIGNLMREISRFSSRVNLSSDAGNAQPKKPRDMQGLDMRCGSRITVTVEGRDEEAAVAAIQDYFVTNM